MRHQRGRFRWTAKAPSAEKHRRRCSKHGFDTLEKTFSYWSMLCETKKKQENASRSVGVNCSGKWWVVFCILMAREADLTGGTCLINMTVDITVSCSEGDGGEKDFGGDYCGSSEIHVLKARMYALGRFGEHARPLQVFDFFAPRPEHVYQRGRMPPCSSQGHGKKLAHT